METNSILSANILDILFDGRNKEYGAYDLRRTYNKRIGSALGVTAIAIIILIVVSTWRNTNARKSIVKPVIDLILSTDREKEKILPIPPVLPKPKQIRTIADPPPIIVIDRLVTEPPVENSKFIDATIDTKTVDGPINNTIPPPADMNGSQVKSEPTVKKEVDENIIIDRVEIEAKFNSNWNAYVKKEIEKDIDELTEAGESGTCIVRFVVSKDGSVSNVEAITMKGTKLAEIAVNAIRKGPRWIPAQQNGHEVNAYRQQPVTFKITD